MSDTIIKVENLSKRYRIGLKEKRADTFTQQMVNALKYPIKNFQQIRNLGKFKEEEEGVHWALKDVSFEVKRGEVLGIIGKNGAGKSTLLKILSRITEPTSGRVEINGRIAALLEVGTGFHPELTGRENIYMNGTILGMTKKEIDRKIDEIIDFSGIEKFVDTPIKFYSSGMKVRLGFSVAAHLDPEILIIDEVLAVGDFEFQQKCLGKMEDVSKSEGRTVLFVSHNMEAVNQLCNKSILLTNGSIEKNGITSELIDFYLKNEVSNAAIKLDSESASKLSNEKVEIVEIYFESKMGKTSLLNIDEEGRLVIFYNVKKKSLKLNLSISIYGPSGEYIMASPSMSDENWYQREHEIGLYKAICLLPEKFFNNSKYFISVLIVENGTSILLESGRVLAIDYYDSGINRKNFFGKWSGLVRPNFQWQVSRANI